MRFCWNFYDQALIWQWLFDSVGDVCCVTWVTDNCFAFMCLTMEQSCGYLCKEAFVAAG